VTSITTVSAYQAMRVPEIWIYRERVLKISILDGDRYIDSDLSPTFPTLQIAILIPQLVQSAIENGTSQMLRSLKIQLER
jgi:hypothetical protein